MKNFINLNYNILKKGTLKGQLNTKTKKVKFVMRGLLSFTYSKAISDFILNHQYLKDSVYRYPILLSKIHRPYLHKNLKTAEKTAAILESYQFIEENFSEDIKKILYKNGEILLSEITGKDEMKLKIYLSIYTLYDKEGEMNIKIVDANNEIISTITFSILHKNFFIGGIQGAKRDLNQEYIKDITKKMYGLFPKRINIEALYALKTALNLNFDILAASNNIHIYKSKRYIRKRVINSNYDEFWNSLGGKLDKHIWILPTTIERKNIDDIPSKKRGQTLKKYALLDEIYDNISLSH